MEIDRYWSMARRRWWVLLLGVLIGSGIGLVVSRQTEPVYQASTKILINRIQIPGISQSQESDRTFNTYGELLRSAPVLQETIQRLNLAATPNSLAQRIGVSQSSDSLIIKLTVEDTDRMRAAAIANQLAQVFIEQNQSIQINGAQQARQQLEQELQQLRQKIDEASTQLSALRSTPAPSLTDTGEVSRIQSDLTQYQDLYFRLLETQQRMEIAQAQATSSLVIAEPAATPTTPVRPLPLQTTLLAGFVGLLLAVGFVLVLEYFDDRVRQPEDVHRRYQLEPLAVLPVANRQPRAKQSRSNGARPGPFGDLAARLPWSRSLEPLSILPVLDNHIAPVAGVSPSLYRYSDGLRVLRANLDFVSNDGALILAITSARRGEGKSSIAANLALAEAQAGKRVVLIDADLREPYLHRFFGMTNTYGLSNVLARSSDERGLHLKAGPFGLWVLTSGPMPPDPTGLMDSQRMAQLIQALRAQADVTILDCPSILDAPDAVILQQYVDGMVLVIDIQRTPFKVIDRALAQMQARKMLGTVLNRSKQHAIRRGRYDRGMDGEAQQPDALDGAQDSSIFLPTPK